MSTSNLESHSCRNPGAWWTILVFSSHVYPREFQMCLHVHTFLSPINCLCSEAVSQGSIRGACDRTWFHKVRKAKLPLLFLSWRGAMYCWQFCCIVVLWVQHVEMREQERQKWFLVDSVKTDRSVPGYQLFKEAVKFFSPRISESRKWECKIKGNFKRIFIF